MWPPGSADTVCPRPPLTLTFDRLTLKLVCESHLRRGTFLPNLGTLSLWVLELFAMYGRTDRQTDGQKQQLLPLPYGRGHNNNTGTMFMVMWSRHIHCDNLPVHMMSVDRREPQTSRVNIYPTCPTKYTCCGHGVRRYACARIQNDSNESVTTSLPSRRHSARKVLVPKTSLRLVRAWSSTTSPPTVSRVALLGCVNPPFNLL